MTKLVVNYETDPHVADNGAAYFHCSKCLEERPNGVSPMGWARQQVAVREDGSVQIRCTRHDLNIAVMTFDLEE